MRKILVVVRREFVERVRNKWFVIATVLGPILMGTAMFLPAYLLTKTGGGRAVAVVDATSDAFGEKLAEVLRGSPTLTVRRVPTEVGQIEDVADSLAKRVGSKAINGFLIVTDEAASEGNVEYRGSDVSSQTAMAILRRMIQDAVLAQRLERVGVDAELVAQARIRVELRTVNIRGGEVTDQSGEAAFVMAYIMWFILYFALIVYGVQVMGAVVEEKSSRVVEVLVSSLRPFELLAGKVVGVGGVGLFQLAIWALVARVLIGQQAFFLDLFNIDLGGEVLRLPEIPADTIAVLLTYFVLGFLLYATMFAAVGAMSNSEAEARQAQTPIVMLIVIPALLSFAALNDPESTIARTLTLVPFSSPIAMPIRWGLAAVPLTDLAGSVGLLIFTSLAVTWVAARIYRVGILMYGKRPGLREVLRWVVSP